MTYEWTEKDAREAAHLDIHDSERTEGIRIYSFLKDSEIGLNIYREYDSDGDRIAAGNADLFRNQAEGVVKIEVPKGCSPCYLARVFRKLAERFESEDGYDLANLPENEFWQDIFPA